MTPNTEQRNDAVRDKIRPSSEIPAAIELWFFRDLGDTQRRQLINWCGIPGVSANGEDFQRECLSAILSALSQPPAPSPLEGEVRERLRIMSKQKLSDEMDSLDQADADWQGAYDYFCTESRAIFAALSTEAGKPASAVNEADVRHLAFILEEWDMKPRPNGWTGHAYEDIARDALARLAISSGRTKGGRWTG